MQLAGGEKKRGQLHTKWFRTERQKPNIHMKNRKMKATKKN